LALQIRGTSHLPIRGQSPYSRPWHSRSEGAGHSKGERPTSAMGQKQTSDWPQLMSALPLKADIAKCDWDVGFVPKADIRVRGWGGKEPGGRHLFGVVKDDSDGVTHPGTNAAHAVPKVDAIRSFRPFYRPVMHGERNCITLLQWHHFHAALHAWPLF
jgi:hypothetical protein